MIRDPTTRLKWYYRICRLKWMSICGIKSYILDAKSEVNSLLHSGLKVMLMSVLWSNPSVSLTELKLILLSRPLSLNGISCLHIQNICLHITTCIQNKWLCKLLLLEFKSVDGPNKKKKIRDRRIMNHTIANYP
jgi:hypothetical protein